jgi:xylulokinase
VPLYDVAARSWPPDVDQPSHDEVIHGLVAPRLAWSSEVVGTVSPAACAATGLPIGTPICAGPSEAPSARSQRNR